MLEGLTTGKVTGLLMLAGVVPAAYVVRYTWADRHNPGVPWFVLAMVAGIGWALTTGLNPLTTDPDVTLFLYNTNVFVVGLAAVCWLLLAIEFTQQIRLSVRAFLVVASVPFATQLLLWTNAVHGLGYTVERSLEANVLRLSPGPLWYLSTGYNYLLVVLGSGMWVGEWLSSEGTRRRQTELFLIATVVLLATGTLFNMIVLSPIETTVPAVLGPIAFISAGGVIAYALTEYQLFQLTPVARETVIQEMDDGVVILDDEGRVVDANASARRLLGGDLTATEVEATDLFADYPELVERLADETDHRTEIRLTVDGVERDVDLNITPIEYGRDRQGRVVVLRDITSLKQRQRDLDLVKGVLARVFRHNVRNDMTAIRGYAEVICERSGGEPASYAEEILDQSDDLLAQAEKTRLIADVIDAEDAVVTVTLGPVVATAVQPHRDGEAAIDVSLAEDVTIRAHRKLSRAIEQLVENAIEHQETDPTVSIWLEHRPDRVGLVVEDSGPGIHESEIEAVLGDEETALEHGSGVGLWIVRWIAEYSGGELELENTGSGTRATIWLQRSQVR